MKLLFFLRGLSILFAAIVIAMIPYCVYNIEMIVYFVWGLFLTLFCILYFYTSKKAICDNGYTYFQAFLFTLKCNKKGINQYNVKNGESIDLMLEIAKTEEYSKSFNEQQIIDLFFSGLDVIKELRKRG